MKPQPTQPAASQRLLSLDALRGFDMLFIMGFAGLVTALCKLCPGEFSDWMTAQMGHADWNGFFHHDTIFPLFLFIAGISFPFSLAKQREKGMSERSIYLKVIRRGLTLVALGFVYSGLFKLDFATLRLPSVLGRIGLAWMFAALLFVNFNVRTRAVIAAAILLGYGLLLQFVAAPDAGGAGPLTLEGNIVGYVDRIVMPSHLLGGRGFDPEGLLSTLPAIVTAMLGMFTGEFVRRQDLSGGRKASWMIAAAVALLVAGLAFNGVVPVKPLANSLLPSSVAPLAVGPMMSIWQVAGSSLKLSKMPCTNGSSGPTTIMSISFSRAKALSAGKSVAFRFTFSPASLVPALPGAIYSFSTFGLWAIFHARACSRPPEPNNNTFMGSFTIYNVQFVCAVGHQVSCTDCYT